MSKYINVDQWLNILRRDLESMHTKQLLSLLENVRIKYMEEKEYRTHGPEDSVNPYLPLYSMLKDILAKREHVPSKPQLKVLRKQAQLAKQNR